MKVAALDGVWAQARWQEFLDFQRLRNLFAHGDGTFDRQASMLVAYVENSPHMTVRNETVQLAATFLPHLLKAQRHLLYGLEEVVVKRFGHGA